MGKTNLFFEVSIRSMRYMIECDGYDVLNGLEPADSGRFRDREASLQICPVTTKEPTNIARQYNIEYRAADAAASPHLALVAVIHAGFQGIEEGLAAPQPNRRRPFSSFTKGTVKAGVCPIA